VYKFFNFFICVCALVFRLLYWQRLTIELKFSFNVLGTDLVGNCDNVEKYFRVVLLVDIYNIMEQ
jgi:hypothetical protein